MKREIEREEEEKQAKFIEAQKAESSCEQSSNEMRYKRLMCLLDRSKFYANFLLQRMASKKEEDKLKVWAR